MNQTGSLRLAVLEIHLLTKHGSKLYISNTGRDIFPIKTLLFDAELQLVDLDYFLLKYGC